MTSVAINVIGWEKGHGTTAMRIVAPALPAVTATDAGRGGQMADPMPIHPPPPIPLVKPRLSTAAAAGALLVVAVLARAIL